MSSHNTPEFSIPVTGNGSVFDPIRPISEEECFYPEDCSQMLHMANDNDPIVAIDYGHVRVFQNKQLSLEIALDGGQITAEVKQSLQNVLLTTEPTTHNEA